MSRMRCGDGSFAVFGNDIAQIDGLFILHFDCPTFRNLKHITIHFGVLDPNDPQIIIFIRLDDLGIAFDLRNDGFAFRSAAGFKQLFDTGQTGCNISALRDTAGMESAEG